jgi:ribosomal protein S18 acetylase RimI-like enzyme
MHIRPADPQRDPQAVAGLIYDTDPYVFPLMFGPRARALPVLAKLFLLEANSFSHRYVTVAETDGAVAGILIGYEPRQIDKQAEEGDFRRVLSAFEQLLMVPKFWILQPFLDKSEINGRYIQNVCVAPPHRGKGMGSGLIRHFCKLAQDAVWLDVEMGNKANRAIYEHMGFRVVREIPIFLPGLGSIRMVRPPEQL